ncbi:MAG: LytTR family DNA-binding domain-containing protein [Oscillospiraceae bacterium]
MKIAILDDVDQDCKLMASVVKRYSQENRIICDATCYQDGKKLLEDIITIEFDMVFLDIFLNNENGMDIAEEIRKQGCNCALVFFTNTAQYAVQSYRVRALNYIMKPYTYEQIKEVLSFYNKESGKNSAYIEVKSGREMVRILYSNIVYIDYYNHYVQIHTKDRVITTYSLFSAFFEQLENEKRFLLCYRNCAINMDEVGKLTQKDFLMSSGDIIPISHKEHKEIRAKYSDYVFNEQ